MIYVATVVAGGLGAVVRLIASAMADQTLGRSGTIVVNTAGSFLAGVAASLAMTTGVADIVAVGFLGGFTTFSTWLLDALTQPAARQSARYAIGSMAVGLAAAALGMAAGAIAA